MLFILIALGVVGGVLATSPLKPLPKHPSPTGPCKPPKCGKNEYFEICSKPCPPQNCSSLWSKYACKEECCRPECRCNDGFMRDDKSGKCITLDECLFPCGPSEHFVRDSNECQLTCANYKVTGPRSLCKPFTGCVCNKGTVRLNDNATGPCIIPKQCPPRKCPLFEHWEDCPSICLKESCVSKSPDYKCLLPAIPLPCKPRCVCNKGFLRDSFGNCIRENRCPNNTRCTDPNAITKECAPNEACRPTCAQPTPGPCPKNCVVNGCECPPGLVLSERGGRCIKIKDCPRNNTRCSDPNAITKECAPNEACRPTCAQPTPGPCPKNCVVNGCECPPGLVLSERGGRCIKIKNCPRNNTRCSDPNAITKECAPNEACRPTCAQPTPGPCPKNCVVNGCECPPGLVLSERGGRCIKIKDCPHNLGCNGDMNAIVKNCPNPCPPTCDDQTPRPCKALCLSTGCECKYGYILSKPGGKCVPISQCRNNTRCSDPNAITKECAPNEACRPTCAQPTPGPCPKNCVVNGCECPPGLVLSERGGRCIKIKDCPHNLGCNGDMNAIVKNCPNPCPPTCDDQTPRPCKALCLSTGCECKYGYILSKPGGKCIPISQCRNNTRCSDPNAITKECAPNEACRPTCAQPTPGPCPKNCVVNGCECPPGLVLSERGGRCIKIKDCPHNLGCNGDMNAIVKNCPNPCPPTCDDQTPRPCKALCLSTGCECKYGYILSKPGGKCIPISQCRNNTRCSDPNAITKECAPNEACRPTCAQPTPGPCPKNCVVNGCECPPGLVLSERGGRCIKIKDCPHNLGCNGDMNAIVKNCPNPCPPTCDDQTPRPCKALCLSTGCECKYGYILSKPGGKCIPISQCRNNTKCSDPNAITKKCAPNEACRPTCAQPTPGHCPKNCVVNGCECPPGLVLSERGGRCIKIEDCPLTNTTCNGDPNAVIKANPLACPSTCDTPNAAPLCKKLGPAVGCECKPGYILSKDGGSCILPNQCPGGNPCGKNANFVYCKVECPNNRCPVDDSREYIPCDPLYPCPSGCACKLNYRRSIDGKCILASNCPPVNCTRQNEIWSPCPSECRREDCADINNQPTTCNTLVLNCQPQCTCKKGHFRNDQDLCIPASQCPNQPCSDPNAERVECAPVCRPTCAKPNPGPCKLSCKLNGCVCKKGFILSAAGTCIPVDQCPKDAPCNGDSNAVIKVKPIPCPSTCASPNASPYCKKYAPEVGCECKPGFIKSRDDLDGKCIEPNTCPGGNPCGPNATFVYCNVNCPTNNCPVNDNRGIIACSPPHPCPSGCACKLNYRRKSSTDSRCILAKECPPVKCTRINEIWSPCPSPCLAENCADIKKQPTTCKPLVLNCQPKCICKKGHFRNDKGTCVPAYQCPNQSCSDPNAERVECAPAPSCRATCAVPNPGPCILSCAINECVCKQGYILSEKGGKCVPIEKCTIQPSCNGDVNAVVKACPLPCPSTCDAPNAIQCRKACQPVGCECKPGYILSKYGGKCILPHKCPGGNPCGKNETYASCKVNCPSDYCPVNNSPNTVVCEVQSPCYSGCVCKVNYRRTSVKDPVCRLASECRPVKCDKNEIWSGCPSDCLAEDCTNVNDCPVTCNTLLLNCRPKCICKKGYFRDSNRKCIPANQCPNVIKCKKNEVYNPCRIKCPPQTCVSILTSYDCSKVNTKCEPGCDCISGYLRNGTETDLCIPSKLCPPPKPVCGLNEHYEINRTKCELTCKNKYLQVPIGPCPPSSGCFCNVGLARNNKGICVKPQQCPKPIICPKNEVLSECYNPCLTTCRTRIRGDGRACHTACIDSGCVCKPGFLRHDNGTCVPISECSPPQCNENETYSRCGTACPPTCQNRGDNCTACTKQCVEGCFCCKGFVRADDGTCVKPKDCPPRTCKDSNEIYDECPPSCPATDGCSLLWSKFNCTGAVRCCKPQCRCKPGLYRGPSGACISAQQCTAPQCNENETYSRCGTACPPTCQNRGDNCTACTKQCVEGCFCSNGFVRADDGTCVKPKDCPPRTCKDSNEIYDECPPSCPATDGCSLLWSKFNCTGAVRCCKPQCRCKPGLYRGPSGACISAQQCTAPQCKENETYSRCGTACPPTCQNRGDNCTACTEQCVEGCFCSNGFVRADDGTCVKPNDCPPRTCKDSNEIYDECPPSCPATDGCSLLWSKFNCTGAVRCCKPQCRCKPGLYRGPSGACISAQQCTAPQCNENETYSRCGTACPPTCQNRGDHCTACTEQCVEGCFCSNGFVRADDGTCVKPEDCPARTCKDSNEIYDECPPSCPATDGCSLLWSKVNCTGAVRCCKPQCRCKPGLYRGASGVCITEKECNKQAIASCPFVAPPPKG